MRAIILNDLDKKIIKRFLEYVPVEFQEYCRNGSAVLIGAIEDEADGLAEAGITVVTIEDNSLVIKWMWMDPDYRFLEGGYAMLKACFLIARTNAFDKVVVQVPAFEDEYAFLNDTATYFFNNGFVYIDETEADGIRVFLLEAPSDGDLRAEGEEAYEDYIKGKIAEEYENFPTEFMEVETEYFSGVPI